MRKAYLLLQDGTVFEGTRFGADRDALCEMVFNTGLTGYHELLTDASYAGQGIVMASPIMGNYGVFADHAESWRPWAEALIVRDLTRLEDDAREAGALETYLLEHGIPGLTCVDTRGLILRLRSSGTMNGLIADAEGFDRENALARLAAHTNVHPVARVSCRETSFHPADADAAGGRRYQVALVDLGLKRGIIRSLNASGCDVTVYPWDTPAADILAAHPDGVVLSNGPGDPKDCAPALPHIRTLTESGVPLFAICLGHQLVALATGADTYKLKFGHRGCNHPVRELATGRVAITSQNHGYAVDADSVDTRIAMVTHVNLNDGTVEGLAYPDRPVFTVQYHPEGSPGPRDSAFLFDRFNRIMAEAG